MDALLAKLRAKLGEAETEAALAKRRAEFGGLLDDAALVLLLLDENGLNDGAVVAVKDLPGRVEATVDVVVKKVFPVREFAREGASGRVANVLVADATGEARLTLWGRDAEKAEDRSLAPGKRVKIVNARVKETQWGLELHVGPWTVLEIKGALDPAHAKLIADTRADASPPPPVTTVEEAPARVAQTSLAAFARETVEGPMAPPPPVPPVPFARVREGDSGFAVEGRLILREPTRTFRRQDGGVGFVANAVLEDETSRATLTLWDEATKAMLPVAPGARVRLTGLAAKSRGGKLEIHTTRATRVIPG